MQSIHWWKQHHDTYQNTKEILMEAIFESPIATAIMTAVETIHEIVDQTKILKPVEALV